MTTQDPFVLERNRSEFTLAEAARLVCGVPLSRRYPIPNKRTQEQRDEMGRVEEALKALIRDAGALQVHPNETTSGGGRRVVSRGIDDFDGQFEPVHTRKDWPNSTVNHEALASWCTNSGIQSAFFSPAPTANERGAPDAAAELNADRAIAAMALVLSRKGEPRFRNGGKPNVSQIAGAVAEAAGELYGTDVKGFNQFRKRLARALKQYPDG